MAHDFFRRDHGGTGTYDRLEAVTGMLLSSRPYAPVMMTVSPETAAEYAQGVKELWQKGFHYFICSLNYAGNWTKESVRELRRQYLELADFYYELTKREEKFYFSPFEVKIASHIQGKQYCHERCELGENRYPSPLTAFSIPVPSLWDTESSRSGRSWAESMRKSVRSCLNAMNWKKRSVRAVSSLDAATVTAAA